MMKLFVGKGVFMCMCYLVYYFGLSLFLSNVALHDFFVSKNVYLYNFVFFFFFFPTENDNWLKSLQANF